MSSAALKISLYVHFSLLTQSISVDVEVCSTSRWEKEWEQKGGELRRTVVYTLPYCLIIEVVGASVQDACAIVKYKAFIAEA